MADLQYIQRDLAPKIKEVDKFYPVVVLTGPRQSGKTTLLRHLYSDYKFVNLEQTGPRYMAQTDPEAFLDSLGSNAIIDEVQNAPQLLSSIQARVDMDRTLRYKLTGSSDFSLMQTITQSLAGRAALFTLLPFAFNELPHNFLSESTNSLQYNGFYPGVIADGIPPHIFYSNYCSTYLERDIRDLLNVRKLDVFNRFMRLLAGRVGSEFNASGLAVEVGVSSPTVSQWLSLLKTSYIAFELPPYFANLNKRLTKSPKVFFYDTGLLCFLLGINDSDQLSVHPLRGAVFENMVVAEMMKRAFNKAQKPNLYFYRQKSGLEVDVLQEQGMDLDLYEIKSARTFRPDFKSNMEKLASILPNVARQTVVYDGDTMGAGVVNFRNL